MDYEDRLFACAWVYKIGSCESCGRDGNDGDHQNYIGGVCGFLLQIHDGNWCMVQAEGRMLLVCVVDGVSALLGHSVADLLHCCVLFLSGIRADAKRHVSELICLSRLAANLSHGSADGLGGGIEER